jgi:hypothetical protein
MLLDKDKIQESIVSYKVDGFTIMAKTWSYDNKATIVVFDKDAKYKQDFYYVLKGETPQPLTDFDALNAEKFENPFDAYAKFQDLLNEQDSQTPPPPPPPEDQKIPLLLKDKKSNEVEIREVNGKMEVSDTALGNGFIVQNSKIKLKSEDTFETELFLATESLEVILIKAEELDTDGKDAYFIIPKQPQPPETQMIVLKNPTTNEIQIREVDANGIVGSQNLGNGFIVEPNLINLASEPTFNTQLYVGGQPTNVSLVRNTNLDTGGLDAYSMSSDGTPPPPPNQTIVLKNKTTNQVQLREVDANNVVSPQSMGNGFIVQPTLISLQSDNKFDTQLFLANNPTNVMLIRNESLDTDGMDAYMMFEDGDNEEKNVVVLKNPTTNRIEIREVDKNNVVDSQAKENGFIVQPSLITLGSDDRFETQMYINGNGEDVKLVRVKSLDTDGLDAYQIEGDGEEKKKAIILKTPFSNQVQIREVDENDVVSSQVGADGFIVQPSLISLASEDEFNTQLFVQGQSNDVKLVRVKSYDTDGLDAYMIVEEGEEEKKVIILKTPSNNQVQIREIDENDVVSSQINGNGFIVQPSLISLASEDTFQTKLFINGQSQDVELVRMESYDTDGLDAYAMVGDGEPKENKRVILLKNKTTNKSEIRELLEDDEIGQLVGDAFIMQNQLMSLASEDEFDTQLFMMADVLDVKLVKNPLFDKNGMDGYNIYIEGDGEPKKGKSEGNPKEIQEEILTDRIDIIAEVSGIDGDVVKNNFRSINLATNFLSQINFKEVQQRLNTNKTAYQLAQEISTELRNS